MRQKMYSKDIILVLAATFFYMSSPMLATPLITGFSESIGATAAVMGFIGGLQNYSIQYAITFGGPGEVINSMQSGTIVPGYYIYRLINGSSRVGPYGYACAMGMVMFLIILVITIINNKFIKSQDSDF